MVSTEAALSARRAVSARSAGQRLLVVEDEPALREMVADNFRMAGYRVTEAADVACARSAIAADKPHLVLLDWMLPDGTGLELLRELRNNKETLTLPVILLTARGDEPDRVRGLDGGADDYVGKPFSLRELEARVRALLRRMPLAGAATSVSAGRLNIDADQHEVSVDGVSVHLGPTEFRLLYFLMSHPLRVYSRTQLLDEVWGRDAYIEERTVDVHIRRLRKNLEEHNVDEYVQTVRGVGYRLAVV